MLLKVTKLEESHTECENESEKKKNDVARPDRIEHVLAFEKKMFWLLLFF